MLIFSICTLFWVYFILKKKSRNLGRLTCARAALPSPSACWSFCVSVIHQTLTWTTRSYTWSFLCKHTGTNHNESAHFWLKQTSQMLKVISIKLATTAGHFLHDLDRENIYMACPTWSFCRFFFFVAWLLALNDTIVIKAFMEPLKKDDYNGSGSTNINVNALTKINMVWAEKSAMETTADFSARNILYICI